MKKENFIYRRIIMIDVPIDKEEISRICNWSGISHPSLTTIKEYYSKVWTDEELMYLATAEDYSVKHQIIEQTVKEQWTNEEIK